MEKGKVNAGDNIYLMTDPSQERVHSVSGNSLDDIVEQLKSKGVLVIPPGRVVERVILENNGKPVQTLNPAYSFPVPILTTLGKVRTSLQNLQFIPQFPYQLIPGGGYPSEGALGTLKTNVSVKIPINPQYYNLDVASTTYLYPAPLTKSAATVNTGAYCRMEYETSGGTRFYQIGPKPSSSPMPAQIELESGVFSWTGTPPVSEGLEEGQIKATFLCSVFNNTGA
tara:strand:+ start:435 stop:1112 length:678 start_codon:yes stop_codon:yes gene_type:complete